jgi:stage V sporulation protein B
VTLKKSSSAKNLFFSGVLALTVANLMVKLVGLIFKVVLINVVGSEGAGYYNSAYEIYAYLYVISTSGLPVALSMMVSRSRARGRLKESRKIFDVAMLVFIAIGVFFSAVMVLFSKNLAEFIKAPETALCIIAIAPTMLFICVSSCLRGYFQGYQIMAPTAVSQFIEAVCKVAIGASLAIWAIHKGYPIHVVAAFAVLGVTIGVFLGMIFLYIRRFFFKEDKYNLHYVETLEITEHTRSAKKLIKELFAIAIPITVSSSVLSLTTIIDTLMVQRELLKHLGNLSLVHTHYGDYTTLVISMTNLPTILLYPIANALVPLITSAHELKDRTAEKRMRAFSMRVILLIAIPCAFGMSIFSREILALMFNEASVNNAAPWLSVSSLSIIFLGIIAITNAYLNSAGKQRLPIVSMVVGAAVKLIGNAILLPQIGMIGASISTVACYFVAAGLNIFFTLKHVGKLPDIRSTFLKPIFCAIPSILLAFGVQVLISMIISSKLIILVSILVAVISYVILILKTKTVSEDEILLLPKGESICKILKKSRILPQKSQNV